MHFRVFKQSFVPFELNALAIFTKPNVSVIKEGPIQALPYQNISLIKEYGVYKQISNISSSTSDVMYKLIRGALLYVRRGQKQEWYAPFHRW